MREIRFRAWNIPEQRMALDVHLEYDTITVTRWVDADENDLSDIPCEESFGDYLTSEDWVVLQYTGMGDKNGTAIYEGDIVKHDGSGALSGTSVVKFMPATSTQAGHGESFFQVGLSFFDGYGREPKNVEVVGNIYENPDLI